MTAGPQRTRTAAAGTPGATHRAAPSGPGRPKDLEKRAAILDAAKRLFLSRGFAATSMDTVAAEAGVSKLTVYNHFRDKDTLFLEAVKAKCEEQMPHEIFAGRATGPIRRRLLSIARAFHALITSDDAVGMYRMMAAEARQSGKLGQLFYEAGPKRTLTEFEATLRAAVTAGRLHVPDPARAAAHFFCLVKGEEHTCLLLGCHAPLSAAEVERHLASVVDLFLRAYAPR